MRQTNSFSHCAMSRSKIVDVAFPCLFDTRLTECVTVINCSVNMLIFQGDLIVNAVEGDGTAARSARAAVPVSPS